MSLSNNLRKVHCYLFLFPCMVNILFPKLERPNSYFQQVVLYLYFGRPSSGKCVPLSMVMLKLIIYKIFKVDEDQSKTIFTQQTGKEKEKYNKQKFLFCAGISKVKPALSFISQLFLDHYTELQPRLTTQVYQSLQAMHSFRFSHHQGPFFHHQGPFFHQLKI